MKIEKENKSYEGISFVRKDDEEEPSELFL